MRRPEPLQEKAFNPGTFANALAVADSDLRQKAQGVQYTMNQNNTSNFVLTCIDVRP